MGVNVADGGVAGDTQTPKQVCLSRARWNRQISFSGNILDPYCKARPSTFLAPRGFMETVGQGSGTAIQEPGEAVLSTTSPRPATVNGKGARALTCSGHRGDYQCAVDAGLFFAYSFTCRARAKTLAMIQARRAMSRTDDGPQQAKPSPAWQVQKTRLV